LNLILLCSKSLNSFEIKTLHPFFKTSQHKICACVIDDRQEKSFFQKIKRHLKKGRGGYVIIMALKFLFKKKSKFSDTARFMKIKNIPLIFAKNIYSKDKLNEIKRFKPDLIILLSGFGILKKPLLELCKYGVLSYHHGDMRKYRGQPPAFWELYNNEKEMGITVQKLSEGMDCGEPIVEKTTPIKCYDALVSLKRRAYEESVDMMFKAVSLIEDTNFIPQKIKQYGKLYTLPNFFQWLMFNLKIINKLIMYKLKLKK